MKLIFFLTTVCALQVSALSYSQSKVLDVNMQGEVGEIFNYIEKTSEFIFFYNESDIDLTKTVHVSGKGQKINEILDQVFAKTNVSYEILDRYIIVHPKNTVSVDLLKRVINLQQQKVSGTITDATTKEPLPGVNVVVEGTTLGTISDTEGKFSLTAPQQNSVLVFSFVGYNTEKISLSGQIELNVTMVPDIKALEEVVVVGYGTQKKRDVTGAVTIVKAEDLNSSSASNFTQAIQGKAAGIQVMQSTGQPGANVSVQLRSNPSNANAGVLYVIDGVPVNDNAGTPNSAKYGTSGTDLSPLNFINPNDIESISFLKDASSASIYGARAGAGVVLITTKRGKSGAPKVNYSASYGVQKADKLFDLLNTHDYMLQSNLIAEEVWLKNNKIGPYYGTVDRSALAPFVPVFTNDQIANTPNYPSALDAIFRQGVTQQHNVSVTGGNDKTTYFISGNYYDQTGTIIGSGLTRYNGKINFDQYIFPKLKMGTSIIVSNSKNRNVITGGSYENGGIVTAAIYYPANQAIQGADGSYLLNPKYPNIPNPLSYKTVTDYTDGNRFLTSAYAEWEIIKGLTAKGNFSYDQSSNTRNSFYPNTFLYGAQAKGLAAKNQNSQNTRLSEWTLNYNKSLMVDRLRFNVLFGYSKQVTNWETLGASNQNFTSDNLLFYNLGAGQALSPSVGSSQSQKTWASYFSRGSISLDQKYILQASIRRDGASNFATNKKWGYFPSVSLSWIVSDENFLKNINAISNLKLRVGYGETGNSNFGGTAFEVYGLGTSPIFGTNTSSSAIYLTQAANPDLTWETAEELNAGIDFDLFNNRISGSVDVFSKTIRNLISQIPLPADNVVSSIWGNSGTTKSEGYEISIMTRNVVSTNNSGFTWTTSVNFSHYLNYWKKRSDAALATLAKYIAVSGRNAPFRGYYGYESDGLFKGEYGTAPSTMPGMLPGGILIKDIQGYDANGNLTGPDGKITSADQTLLFNQDPKFNFGIGNTFTFKNFDLNIHFSGAIQKKLDPLAPTGIYRLSLVQDNLYTYGWNEATSVKDRWTFQNPTSSNPTGLSDGTYSSFQNNSDHWVVDASYLRCKNITIGYTFNNKSNLLKFISSVRLYADFENMFTITSYKGLDPEINQNNYYPLSKSYMGGINVSF